MIEAIRDLYYHTSDVCSFTYCNFIVPQLSNGCEYLGIQISNCIHIYRKTICFEFTLVNNMIPLGTDINKNSKHSRGTH